MAGPPAADRDAAARPGESGVIWDTFMGSQELDMLRCRIHELRRIPNLVHVLVEADVDHQGNPKPYYFTESGIADEYGDRLRIVRATGLPTSPDPWSREHAQREWVREGILDADPGDVILHGDIDEIPTAVFAAHVRPRGFVVAGQRFHPFAVDWQHPQTWPGTVAALVGKVSSFARMRDARLTAEIIPGSGWHFSWVGGVEYATEKLAAFAHPEVRAWAGAPLSNGDLWAHGYHVDGTRLDPVDVDRTWPEWVRTDLCPAVWFRPRNIERQVLDFRAGQIVKSS